MGLSIRIFIVEDDDTIKRLPLARYERLLKGDPDVRLSEYAGKRVRYALIVVDLVNRRPIEVVKLAKMKISIRHPLILKFCIALSNLKIYDSTDTVDCAS